MLVRRHLVPVVAGIGVGVVVAALAAGRVRDLLFDVSPWDPRIYSAAVAVLAAAAMLASWLPVRRVARVKLTEVLRDS